MVEATERMRLAVFRIRVADVKINHERFRKGLGEDRRSKEKFEQLKQSLTQFGQFHPILLDTHDELAAGFRRLKAAEALGWEFIEAKRWDDLDEIERREIELEENLQRLDMTPAEEQSALAEIHRLRVAKDPTWGQQQTAAMTGKAQARVSEALKIAPMLALFPELAKAKTVTQLKSWVEQKAKSVMRVQEVKENPTKYTSIEERLILGDSREVIKTFADGEFHAIITDPPFGIDFDEKVSETIGSVTSYEDDRQLYESFLAMAPEMYRVLREDGWLVWFLGVSWYERAKLAFRQAGFTVDEIPIVWDRSDGKTYSRRADRWFGRGYDIALHAVKGSPELTKRDRSNVFRFKPVDPKDKEQLVERPVELYEELIRYLTVKGENVLDLFAGSGSCPAAAEKLGRNWKAVELSPERRARAIQKIYANSPR